MKLARPRIGLPLLTKELLEQAARRRTYVIRVLYAVLLFAAAFLMFYDILGQRTQSAFAVLGRGRQMFEALVGLQFAGIYLFMPAITCGVLTQEKERSSLELLFLTRLGPWTILAEKLFSRLVPMFSFLLLSLPLLAFAYSLGGISPDYFWSGVWFLGLTVLQTGTLALACSAFFRTTVGAFIGSYLIGTAAIFLPIITASLLHEARIVDFGPLLAFLNALLSVNASNATVLHHPPDAAALFFSPFLFFEIAPRGGVSYVLIISVPLLAWSAACFLLARIFIVRRAFVPARNPLLRFFKALDARLSSLNDRFARGVILLRESTLLPEDEPIAWRETAKKSLGTVRYLVRVFLALEVPTAAICLLVVIFNVNSSSRLEEVSVLLFFIWTIVAMLLSVASTSLIAAERSHQTLDVLLTTPLSGREIVLQKMRGARRLMAVLLVPFFTIFLLQSTWKGILQESSYGGMRFSMLVYLTCSALSVLVYLPLIAWLSFLIGLRLRSQSRAIIVAVAALAGWCVVPYFVPLVREILVQPVRVEGGMAYFLLVSPMTIIPANEFYQYEPFGSALAPVVINFAMHGAILYGLRGQVLANADRWLGRNAGA